MEKIVRTYVHGIDGHDTIVILNNHLEKGWKIKESFYITDEVQDYLVYKDEEEIKNIDKNVEYYRNLAESYGKRIIELMLDQIE